MALTPHDLKRGAEALNKRIEDKHKAQGERAAENLIQKTREGGGLWFFVRFPVWLVCGGMISENVVGGTLFPIVWALITIGGYAGSPLKRSPILEAICVIIGIPILIRLIA